MSVVYFHWEKIHKLLKNILRIMLIMKKRLLLFFFYLLLIKIFLQIVIAISYLHFKHLLHLRLNPQNIFISPKGDVKLGI
jgi:serine/threonine protein kinase